MIVQRDASMLRIYRANSSMEGRLLHESDEILTKVVTQTPSSTLSCRKMSFWIERVSVLRGCYG